MRRSQKHLQGLFLLGGLGVGGVTRGFKKKDESRVETVPFHIAEKKCIAPIKYGLANNRTS